MIHRNAYIEKLRVICMFMITTLHALGHGGVLNSYSFNSIGFYCFWLIEAFCVVGVNVFILISGYYYRSKRKRKISRIVKLWFKVELFSILCLVLRMVLDKNIKIADAIFCFLPITSMRYWFATCYMLLLIFQPILDSLIDSTDKKKHLGIIGVNILMFCIIPTLFPWSREAFGEGMDVLWFITLYFIGAYLGKYGVNNNWSSNKSNKYLKKYLLLVITLFMSNVIISYITIKLIGIIKGNSMFYSYNSIIVLMASIALFVSFISREKHSTSITSKFGKYCFGVYLISDHRVIREALWSHIDIIGHSKGDVLITLGIMIASVIFIMSMGIIIDFGVSILVKKINFDLIDNIELKRFCMNNK